MESADEQQCIYPETEWSQSLISRLPDEVILEIFASYRQGNVRQWRKEHVWINLTQVCKKWRAIVFASSSRLDLGITVGPVKPGHIKTILSSPLPIFIGYKNIWQGITGSALWRIRAALKHGVRKITFSGKSDNFDRIFKNSKCAFPDLESLHLHFGRGKQRHIDMKLLDLFLGPDLSNPHLQRLGLCGVSLASISKILLSATSLTDIYLRIHPCFSPSSERSFLDCLHGMTCMRSLVLIISCSHRPLKCKSFPEVDPLSKLAYFCYFGPSKFLDALVAGISVSSLRDVYIQFDQAIRDPIMHLPRFIDEIQGCYHAVHADFKLIERVFRLSLLTESEYISHRKPRFILESRNCSPVSIVQMSAAFSVKLTTVEQLHVTFDKAPAIDWGDHMLWRRFYQQFPSVKALWTKKKDAIRIARTLCQDHEQLVDPAFLHALEETTPARDHWLTGANVKFPLRHLSSLPLYVDEQAGQSLFFNVS